MANYLRVTFLGTGTSQGVPVIGCECAVCRSADPRDQRLRTSALLQFDGFNYVIDSGPDFRQQMLRAGINRLSGVLLTHEHNDHIIGLDDIRPFNFMQKSDMPVYATARVADELRSRFSYIFESNPYPGAPQVKIIPIHKDTAFTLIGHTVTPIQVMHGKMPALGFRIGDFAYLTDMHTISKQEFEKLKGLRVLTVSALHHKPHHSHMNLEQAIAFARRVGAEETYFIHISHRMGLHRDIDAILPAGITMAYDGLQIQLNLDGQVPHARK